MNPSDIRAELLGHHREIRAQIDELREDLEDCPSGGESRDDLRAALLLLAQRVRAHNEREEELLGDLLPGVDAWGPVRTEVMLREHAKEHEELYDALLVAGDAPDAGRATIDLLRKMLAHMEHEEHIFLSEEVLSDGVVHGDPMGG